MHKAGFIGLLIVTIALISMASPALATLSPISFGFPTLTTMNTATAFNTANINAFDFETANVNFPQLGGSSFGFPMVSQSEVTGQTAHTVDFAQTTQFSSFSYPAINTGLGLSGFWGF